MTDDGRSPGIPRQDFGGKAREEHRRAYAQYSSVVSQSIFEAYRAAAQRIDFAPESLAQTLANVINARRVTAVVARVDAAGRRVLYPPDIGLNLIRLLSLDFVQLKDSSVEPVTGDWIFSIAHPTHLQSTAEPIAPGWAKIRFASKLNDIAAAIQISNWDDAAESAFQELVEATLSAEYVDKGSLSGAIKPPDDSPEAEEGAYNEEGRLNEVYVGSGIDQLTSNIDYILNLLGPPPQAAGLKNSTEPLLPLGAS